MAQPGDYVVCLGAGSITQWAYALPGELAAAGDALMTFPDLVAGRSKPHADAARPASRRTNRSPN